eukprot:4534560-Prymnesium_polylepis.1
MPTTQTHPTRRPRPSVAGSQVACMFAEALEAADLAMGSDKAADYTARGDFLDARSLHEWYE